MRGIVLRTMERAHCGAGEEVVVDRTGVPHVVTLGTGDVEALVPCEDCRMSGRCHHRGCQGICVICVGTGRTRVFVVEGGMEVDA